MSAGEIAIIMGAILAPVASIIAAVITVNQMRKKDNDTKEVATKGVKVEEKNAHTQEIDMMIGGFTASLEAVNAELKRTQTSNTDLNEKYDTLHKKYDHLIEEVNLFKIERTEMIKHIKALEELVPSPPGPPIRPVWESK